MPLSKSQRSTLTRKSTAKDLLRYDLLRLIEKQLNAEDLAFLQGLAAEHRWGRIERGRQEPLASYLDALLQFHSGGIRAVTTLATTAETAKEFLPVVLDIMTELAEGPCFSAVCSIGEALPELPFTTEDHAVQQIAHTLAGLIEDGVKPNDNEQRRARRFCHGHLAVTHGDEQLWLVILLEDIGNRESLDMLKQLDDLEYEVEEMRDSVVAKLEKSQHPAAKKKKK